MSKKLALALGSAFLPALVACTALLGSYEVGPAGPVASEGGGVDATGDVGTVDSGPDEAGRRTVEKRNFPSQKGRRDEAEGRIGRDDRADRSQQKPGAPRLRQSCSASQKTLASVASRSNASALACRLTLIDGLTGASSACPASAQIGWVIAIGATSDIWMPIQATTPTKSAAGTPMRRMDIACGRSSKRRNSSYKTSMPGKIIPFSPQARTRLAPSHNGAHASPPISATNTIWSIVSPIDRTRSASTAPDRDSTEAVKAEETLGELNVATRVHFIFFHATAVRVK